jgi:hypothetical protein
MSTIGTIVDILTKVPDAVGPIAALVRRIRDARPEDRVVLLAAVKRAAESSHAAFVEADARLLERFPVAPPVPESET